MAATRSSNSNVPLWRSPLMKNVGVPFTPLRTPPRKSARTLGAYFPAANASHRSASGKPSAPAKANSRGKPN